MKLSDLAMYRPASAVVLNILLMLFGIIGFSMLPVREMPDIESSVVSIGTPYRGSASSIVESQITKPIEDQLSGIDGIDTIWSSSWDGWSGINITFKPGHDMSEAVSDVRDAVSRARSRLPDDVDESIVKKNDSEGAPFMWLNITSTKHSRLELSDYVDRILIDQFSLLPGVSTINTSGVDERVLYIEIDPQALAARNLTTNDISQALNRENLQLPAGYVKNQSLNIVVRLDRLYQKVEDFNRLQIKSIDGLPIELQDIATIYIGSKKESTTFKANNIDSMGLGIIAISKANPLEVSDTVHDELVRLRHFLPKGVEVQVDYDSTIFIREAIKEIYITLAITAFLVISILYLFLARLNTTIIPAITVPISLIAAFSVAYLCGYSVNLVTLMALILAIGLVVDDAIVIVENIMRHRANGASPIMAAFHGAKELNFAVIATTLVLVMTFLPLIFLEGKIGDLFTEFAVLLSAAVISSSIAALTIGPVLAEKLFSQPLQNPNKVCTIFAAQITKLQRFYRTMLIRTLSFKYIALFILTLCFVGLYFAFQAQQKALVPIEDRGNVNIYVGGTEATSYQRMVESMEQINDRLMPLAADDGPIDSLNYSAPAFGSWADHQGFFIIRLKHWSERNESASEVVNIIRDLTHDVTDVGVHPYQPGFGGGSGEAVQFVLQGEDYQSLYAYAQKLEIQAEQSGLMLNTKLDYNPTTPELLINVNREAAKLLEISVDQIASTLEVLLGGRSQTRFEINGDEYDVYLKAHEDHFNSYQDLSKVYLHSAQGELIGLNNVITIDEVASARGLFHYQRKKSINLKANLAEGVALGEALNYLNHQANSILPVGYSYDYAGESKDYYDNQKEVGLLFLLAIFICYLVLAAQFESFISPVIVMLTVPLGLLGGLIGLIVTGETFNIYSQLGLLVLIGMATKNGILIVEFANQLRDQGLSAYDAILNASEQRLRPILMTAMTTLLGAIPMLVASGAGAETRFAVGIVIFSGMLLTTFVTLFIVPNLYNLIGGYTHSPEARVEALDLALKSSE
ncbi:multidrug transporter AcrB [Vibrio sp. 10N.286.49.B3]|uniref:efflux RND transporter permease subunit n=1 Tax=Vibrio sp. 10N.286.49.B3 TaxID=1880855 RepID=UPI000C856ADF|nr:efflux RND transporter permease subunit [Vibrio sp. 10N.286.49.B3]PMH43765.1 multidrug transporter AcrB [Vibrio sp. 10N.286.49.B3]